MRVTASIDRRVERDPDDRWLFAVAVLSSAFLLFLVQPMVAKRILPWFGGTPGVWSACLAFYQTMLFVGYAYAHGLIRFARPRVQIAIHVVLCTAAWIALPVLPGAEWQPRGSVDPRGDIVVLLLAHVALPFLVLSSTGPLVQAWFARRNPTRSPYPLYAVSNLGSLLALLGYPFLIEPNWTLGAASAAWSIAFALCCVAVVACAVLAARSLQAAGPTRSAVPSGVIGSGDRTGVGRRLAWLAFPGCAVIVLMAVTNKVCLDVASVPFLWILPLSAYLLTFILCFSSERASHRGAWLAVTLIALVATSGRPLWIALLGSPIDAALASLAFQVPAWCGLLFGAGMLLHGELYRLRPAPDGLTSFYLYVSAGGALGGLFVGLAAPGLFDDYYELPIGLVGGALLLWGTRSMDPTSRLHLAGSRRRWLIHLPLMGCLVAGAAIGAGHRFDGLRHRERSFFGVLRVIERGEGDGVQRQLASGSTVHGVQSTWPGRQAIPTSYYGRGTGLGLWLGQRSGDPAMRIGVIGLGVGTLSAYGRRGDHIRYYEIDPAVVRIARDDGFFTYLATSDAGTEVVLGDARISLEREGRTDERDRFDLLVLDAFNSDAIPIHLLTREAFETYADALRPDGLLFVHTSNRHFDLMPLVARQGFEVGFESLYIESAHVPQLQSHRALWVVLARENGSLDAVTARLRERVRALGLPREHLALTRPLPGELAGIRVWTDDYSDLLGVLRRP